MFPAVWERISLGEYPSVAATLQGYAIYRVKNAVFPGIIESNADDQVQGVVYYDLDEQTMFELEMYESDLYERVSTEATTVQGNVVPCEVFRIPLSRKDVLSNETWDPRSFEQHNLNRYLEGQ